MADRPAVKTRKLTREKLASFLKSHELIKAFENLAQDVAETLPDAVEDSNANNDQARDTAAMALAAAAAARAAGDRLLLLLGELESHINAQHDRGAQVADVRRRLDELDTRVQALERRAPAEDLRRQIDELRTLILGS